MSIQDWGLDWFNGIRNQHCVEDVIIVTSEAQRPIKASVVEPESEVNTQGVRVKTDKMMFIVNTRDIEGLRITRGVRILRGRDTYEVIIDKLRQEDMNDSQGNEVNIRTKRCT